MVGGGGLGFLLDMGVGFGLGFGVGVYLLWRLCMRVYDGVLEVLV